MGQRKPPSPPRCFCGAACALQSRAFSCASHRCAFKLIARPDGTPEKPAFARSPFATPGAPLSVPSDRVPPGPTVRGPAQVPLAHPFATLGTTARFAAGLGRGEMEKVPETVTVNCNCALPAARRTVKKAGPNVGKIFFVCGKPQSQQCKFFDWEKPDVPVQVGMGSAGAKRKLDVCDNAEKRVRSGSVVLIMHLAEIDALQFRLHMGLDPDFIAAVKAFDGIKIRRTEILGVEEAVVPFEKLEAFKAGVFSKYGVSMEFNFPPILRMRIQNYRKAEQQRIDSGDVVTRPLDEILPALICEKLMEFQWEGVHFALRHGGRCLIGDDMGLGKTLQAIAIARVYMNDWPLLIVCPSSLRLNWKDEFLLWLGEDVEAEDINVIMKGADSEKPLRRINIVSYDLVRKLPQRQLNSFRFVIADESHYLKSTTAKRTQAMAPLIRSAKRALLLSGTPALSRPVELFQQINAIAPILFPHYQDFVKRYCAAHQGHFGYDVSGASNLDELHTLLRGSVLIRRKKEDVLTQLPAKQRHVMWVETKPKMMKEVEAAFVEFEEAKEAANSAGSPEEAFICSNAVKSAQNKLYSLTGMAKVDSVLEFVKETAEAGGKFIVFAHHKEVIEKTDEYLKTKLKLGFIRIDGKTAQHARQGLCKKFQEDPNCRVALLSITAAGVGLTLTAATCVIFAELYWNPGSLLQAEDRAHRIGQRDCVMVKYMLARKTLDEQIWKSVMRKLEVVGHSLTGAAARMEVADELEKPLPSRSGPITSYLDRAKPLDIQDDVEIVEPTTGIMAAANDERARDTQIFPTSLRDVSDFASSAFVTSAAGARQAMRASHEQYDADVALARQLQRQFDAEEAAAAARYEAASGVAAAALAGHGQSLY